MAPSRVILVTAASGNIGEPLIPLLASDPTIKLVVPTSRASSLQAQLAQHQQCQAGSNVFIEEGSVKDPAWFQGLLASHKVDTVFLNLAGDDELFTSLNCLDAVSRSGTVKQLIYLSACMDFDSHESIQHWITVCSAAHVLVKPIVEQKLVHGNLPFDWTILRPTLFFTNDLRSRQSMLETGVLGVPFGEAGLSRVAPWDIALAVKNLMTAYGNGGSTKKWNHQKVAIGSRKAFKGSEIARVWSEAVKKEVNVLPANEEGFQKLEDGFSALAGPAWGRDLRLMHETFAAHGFGMTEEQYQQQVELLGKEPADYEEWLKSTGAQWV
ncbi:uncharacterized protein PG986_012258 [Apiospora aurea]|uniref:NmrA-like domain-containing protein n=1 Tax=Apiospora aurea TaxID=335848 RepID=A0ABR1PZQ9_9PEZI